MAKKTKEVPNVKTASQADTTPPGWEGLEAAYQAAQGSQNYSVNIFEAENPGPQVGDWVKVNLSESILIREVVLVVGAKVYLTSGGFVLAQDIIEIR